MNYEQLEDALRYEDNVINKKKTRKGKKKAKKANMEYMEH